MSEKSESKKTAPATQSGSGESKKPEIRVKVTEMIEGHRGMTHHVGAVVMMTADEVAKYETKVTRL